MGWSNEGRRKAMKRAVTRRAEATARVEPIKRHRTMPSHHDLRKRMPRMRRTSEKLVREDREGQ